MMRDAKTESGSFHNPGILRGRPIIRDTRVPVFLIAGFVSNGMNPAGVVEDYPDLTVEAAVAIAGSEQAAWQGKASGAQAIISAESVLRR